MNVTIRKTQHFITIAFTVLLAALSFEVKAQDQGTRTLTAGERVEKLKGIVAKRDPDHFTMMDPTGGPRLVVVLTPDTEVKSHKKGLIRGSKEYGASYILRGLRLEVDGVGNDQGQLVAEKIRFDEQDLRSAQALQATVDPLETEAREKLKQQQAENERLAGQIAENQALAETARAEAAKAQATADTANNRINGLDDFDPLRTITVLFAPNSATLGPKGKTEIDKAAAWVKTQDTKGWVMAVIGYADSSGNSAKNIDLSERRAHAVIYYIVTKYKMPMHRLVQPFGYGQLEAVADNTTAAGRAKNRRVEIRLMVNRGIAGTSAAN
jgi:OmpA-OmpF porin, OOP family